MPNFINVYTGAASSDYCERMMKRLDDLEKNSSGNLGHVDQGGVQNRKDVSFYFQRDAEDLSNETNSILDECLGKYIEEHPSLGMLHIGSHAVKVQRTPPKGGFHLWHCEQGNGDATSTRSLVWMIYLNDTPEGEGTTEFIEQGIRVQPKQGDVLFWPASWTHTHRGNPVYTTDKYIATGWYYLFGS